MNYKTKRVVTRGMHPWNIIMGKRECPVCRSRDISEDWCNNCQYTPELKR